MKIKKPKFWDYKKPNFLALLLWPISLIVKILIFLKKNKKIKYTKIKTVCVGNIYIGGTGKTSLAIELKKIFNNQNISSCFIKKHYTNQKDEIRLLRKHGRTIVHKSRSEALKRAIDENFEIAIFDDGLQDNSIYYDLSFVCFNKLNWIGNGMLIPAGPLRENLKKINSYKNIFLNGNNENLINIKKQIKKLNLNLNIFDSEYHIINTDNFSKKQKYLAFSGIGNHQTFINMLKNNKFKIVEDLEFPDHYNYRNKDIDKINFISKNLNAKIITTEKDFLRSNILQKNNIQYIESKLELKNKDELINQLII